MGLPGWVFRNGSTVGGVLEEAGKEMLESWNSYLCPRLPNKFLQTQGLKRTHTYPVQFCVWAGLFTSGGFRGENLFAHLFQLLEEPVFLGLWPLPHITLTTAFVITSPSLTLILQLLVIKTLVPQLASPLHPGAAVQHGLLPYIQKQAGRCNRLQHPQVHLQGNSSHGLCVCKKHFQK